MTASPKIEDEDDEMAKNTNSKELKNAVINGTGRLKCITDKPPLQHTLLATWFGSFTN